MATMEEYKLVSRFWNHLNEIFVCRKWIEDHQGPEHQENRQLFSDHEFYWTYEALATTFGMNYTQRRLVLLESRAHPRLMRGVPNIRDLIQSDLFVVELTNGSSIKRKIGYYVFWILKIKEMKQELKDELYNLSARYPEQAAALKIVEALQEEEEGEGYNWSVKKLREFLNENPIGYIHEYFSFSSLLNLMETCSVYVLMYHYRKLEIRYQLEFILLCGRHERASHKKKNESQLVRLMDKSLLYIILNFVMHG